MSEAVREEMRPYRESLAFSFAPLTPSVHRDLHDWSTGDLCHGAELLQAALNLCGR